MNANLFLESKDINLIDLLVDSERATALKQLSMHLHSITLNDHQLCDIELLTTGAFSPLTGFMTRSDYEGCFRPHAVAGRHYLAAADLFECV